MIKGKKIRLVTGREVKEAYRMDDSIGEEPVEEDMVEKIDRLPEESFKIIGKLVSFIEVANRLEGEGNEDK